MGKVKDGGYESAMIQARATQETNTILHEPVPDPFVKERILVSIYLKREKKNPFFLERERMVSFFMATFV